MKLDEEILINRIRWGLIGLTAAIYWQVSSHPFINYDDAVFVFENPHVYSGLNLRNILWSFTTLNGGASSYHPLTWLSHQLDCQLFGLKPGVQHLTNLMFHVANTAMLFTFLQQMTRNVWRSATVAALFALHPMHIETVAWISERKSLVCFFFWMLTMLAYLRYVREGAVSNYLLLMALYVASLLSKPIAVSLPITLLLLDYWPLNRVHNPEQVSNTLGFPAQIWNELRNLVRRRLSTAPGDSSAGQSAACATEHEQVSSPASRASAGMLFVEKLPFLLVSGLACFVTVIAQRQLGAVKSLEDVPMGVRLSNSVVAPVLYLRKMIWPSDLAPIYPLRTDWSALQVVGCALILLFISLWVAFEVRRRPHLIVGWVWYLVTLLPTLGLVQVGSQGMADRYSYVPLIGVFIAIVWEVSNRVTGISFEQPIKTLGALGAVAGCVACTVATLPHWRNSVALFDHAVRVTDHNYIARGQLGIAFLDVGKLPEAETELRESLRIHPNRALTEEWLAQVLFLSGDNSGAFDYLTNALKLEPDSPMIHEKLAELFSQSKDPRFHDPCKALEQQQRACQLNHYRNCEAMQELAHLLAENGRWKEAHDAAKQAQTLCIAPQETWKVTKLLTELREMEVSREETVAKGTSQ